MQDQFGQKPINFKWNIVRGDTAELKLEFLENDEVTGIDTDGWTIEATAYDYKGDIVDELDVEIDGHIINVIAPSDITETWGAGYSSVVAELAFDVQITVDNKVWTPIVGTIVVSGDITGSL